MPDRCDPFLLRYSVSERRIASEFLTTWMPFLSRDLCHGCVKILSDRVHSLSSETDGAVEPSSSGENTSALTTNDEYGDAGNCDSHSLGSWKDEGEETNSLGIWKDESKGLSDPAVADVSDASAQEMVGENAPVESTSVRMSWADMAQEDELEQEGDNEINKLSGDGDESSGEMGSAARRRTELSRDQREYLRFMNVKRKKDFICLERINGKIVNILQGLELHTGVFSAVEQKRIVDYIYSLQEMGSKGELKERTYTAPRKWMRGKGRVTVQFGCCYNYATDKNGNPPGILQNEEVDPLPPLFKVIIRRLVKWHVLPPSCVPDSCIVNVYDEGDCIPPHIDNHDFVRPFCTISFLSECNIVFGTDLKIVGPGEFDGAFAIPLPVGSVLVLNGNGADVAKHCVPAVPSKRISITFRNMDESKRPIGYAPEPDLQGLEPLRYMDEPSRKSTPPHHRSRQPMDESRRPIEPDWQGWRNGPRQSSRGGFGFRSEGRRVEEGRYSSRNRGGPRARVNLG